MMMLISHVILRLKRVTVKRCLMLCVKEKIICVHCLKNKYKNAMLVSKTVKNAALKCVLKYMLDTLNEGIIEEGTP